MDGLRINGVSLFLGKIPSRKQECFYFAEGTFLYPIAYISDKTLPEAKRLWGKMINSICLCKRETAAQDSQQGNSPLHK